jgi:HlyD family secretion protein
VTAGDTNGAQTEVLGAGLKPGVQVITGTLVAGADRSSARRGAGRRPGGQGGQGRQGGQGGGAGSGGQGGN